MSGIRVVLADDHAAIRLGLRTMLENAGIVVVGEAAQGDEAVTLAAELAPDVVLMDIRMPGRDGISATRQITREALADVLVLTTFDLDEFVFEAMRAGAAGFLLKTVEPDDLVAAIRHVAAGDGVIAPQVTRRLLAAFAGEPGRGTGRETANVREPGQAVRHPQGAPAREDAGRGVDELTTRERDVLGALGRGLSNQQIAGELSISEATTKTHVSRVLRKLDCTSRMQAAIVARESGLA
ncbi:response regulator transcription factor [Microbacterium sp. MPKO10]|nr:response regulator transcription factor [Microbacterium sp. MPKO10]MCW4457005.1 response regulator transcription factor [Microbacterium sp. MPKO10]